MLGQADPLPYILREKFKVISRKNLGRTGVYIRKREDRKAVIWNQASTRGTAEGRRGEAETEVLCFRY